MVSGAGGREGEVTPGQRARRGEEGTALTLVTSGARGAPRLPASAAPESSWPGLVPPVLGAQARTEASFRGRLTEPSQEAGVWNQRPLVNPAAALLSPLVVLQPLPAQRPSTPVSSADPRAAPGPPPRAQTLFLPVLEGL